MLDLNNILSKLLLYPEDEIVEFKLARNDFSFDELGKYFSALSNEANLHGKEFSWLVFGVEDKTHEIPGSHYRVRQPPLLSRRRAPLPEGHNSPERR